MLRSLNSGVSGLRQFQSEMDIIGNNIANSNTLAFKAARADFSDALSQTLQAPSSAGGTPGIQVGNGVTTASVTYLLNQGAVTDTGVQSDLAISGAGYFVVRDVNTNQEYATRAGDFRVDDTGFLITSGGLRVQGFTDGALTTRGDVQIDGTGRPATSDPAAVIQNYSISSGGQITVRLSDNTEYVRGQVLLQNFQNPQSLMRQGNNLYSNLSQAGPMAQTESPGTQGLGQLQTSSLEMSNVDLTSEFAGLITTQRGFQASARIITTSDEMLQELVNLKR
jgi:flagellar hook protein FlgE